MVKTVGHVAIKEISKGCIELSPNLKTYRNSTIFACLVVVIIAVVPFFFDNTGNDNWLAPFFLIVSPLLLLGFIHSYFHTKRNPWKIIIDSNTKEITFPDKKIAFDDVQVLWVIKDNDSENDMYRIAFHTCPIRYVPEKMYKEDVVFLVHKIAFILGKKVKHK